MERVERFYKIEAALRDRKSVSFEDLLLLLEVSRATLKRDLAFLRDRMQAPIVWDRLSGTYRYEDLPAGETSKHQLPGLWFSSNEIQALLTMQHLLTSLDAGDMLRPHLRPLANRLEALLEKGTNPEAKNEAQELRRRVRIIGLAHRTVQPTHFQIVGTALVQRKQLNVRYLARGSGQETQRILSPQRLMHYRGNWYLDAWCHLRHELRSFALDALQDAKLLEQTADDISDEQLHALFAPSYGIFSGSAVEWTKLLFSPERARWISTEQWHPKQQGQWQANGSYLLSIPFADHRELIMDILKHGEHCEVIEPASLRMRVAEQTRAMTKKYS